MLIINSIYLFIELVNNNLLNVLFVLDCNMRVFFEVNKSEKFLFFFRLFGIFKFRNEV